MLKIMLIVPHVQPTIDNQLDLKFLSRMFNGVSKKGGSSLMGCIPSAVPTIAALTPDDVSVSIVDENIDNIDFEKDVDVVGISFLTVSAFRAYAIADEFRQRGVHTVLGGVHATMFPEEALEHGDTVFVGEAEDTWPEFIADFKNNQPKRKYIPQEKPDLQKLVVPRWDLLKRKYYNIFHVQTTRGCPFNCDFCAVRAYQGEPRFKPIAHVIEEIKAQKKYGKIPGVQSILFADDNIISKKSYARELFKALIPLKVSWSSQISINLARDEELLDLAAQSGCESLLIGFESISQQSLNSVNKGMLNKIELYKEAVEKIHSRGIVIFPMFILGFDEDDKSSFEDLARFIEETNILFPVFNILTPIPGTRLFDKLEQEGRILSKDWSRYNGSHVCFEPKNMSAWELENGYYWLLKTVYSSEACFRRIEALWQAGVIRREKKHSVVKALLQFKFRQAQLRQPRPVREFIDTAIEELKNKKHLDLLALPFMLDFYCFARNLPEPAAGFEEMQICG